MLHSLFEAGALSPYLMEANISFVLKKGKLREGYLSYLPISILNLDLNLLAKILALHLENVLPSIIANDHGFIRGQYSAYNVWLLNVIQHSSMYNSEAFVVSLNAKNAFDQLETPIFFPTLHKFGLGEDFIKWIWILYTSL